MHNVIFFMYKFGFELVTISIQRVFIGTYYKNAYYDFILAKQLVLSRYFII